MHCQEEMELWAKQCHPNEACGLVLKVKNKHVFYPCRNTHAQPKNNFTISAFDYVAARGLGDIVAVFHSHPSGSNKPSPIDLASCNAGSTPWLILGIAKTGDTFNLTEINQIIPDSVELSYEGRPYVWGLHDCYSLVREYLANELDIHLNDYDRAPEANKADHPIFAQQFQAEGYRLMPEGTEPIEGDLALIGTGHIALFVDSGRILHHLIGRPSRIDVYAGYWKKNTTHHLRHKSKC